MNEPLNEPPDDRIIKSLSALQNIPPRSPDVEKSGRARFLQEAAALRQNGCASRQKRQLNGHAMFSLLFSRKTRPIWMAAAAVFMAIALILGSGGAVVYASQDSLPGQALYPVKLFSEDIRLKLANDPPSQLQLNLEFANRRLDEIDRLASSGKEPTDDVMNRLQKELDNSILGAAGLNDNDARTALENLRNNLQRHADQLIKLESQANPRAAAEYNRLVEMLKARVNLAEQGIKDPQALHKLMKQRKEQIKEQSSATPQVQPGDTATATEEPAVTETAEDKNQNACKGQGKAKGCDQSPQLTPTPQELIIKTPPGIPPVMTPNENHGNDNKGDYGNGPKK
ncbi:MAG: hypothetical protein IMZ62_05555 [Chloroflexi bacterium]|nr:hypothetical protein [Chloroflexota bacterium]